MPISDEKWWMFCHGKSRIYARWNKEEEDDEDEEAALFQLWKSKGKPQFGGSTTSYGLAGAAGAPEQQQKKERTLEETTEAFFQVMRESEERKKSHQRWCRDRSRSRQKKHGLPTPEQLRECSSRPLVVL